MSYVVKGNVQSTCTVCSKRFSPVCCLCVFLCLVLQRNTACFQNLAIDFDLRYANNTAVVLEYYIKLTY